MIDSINKGIVEKKRVMNAFRNL